MLASLDYQMCDLRVKHLGGHYSVRIPPTALRIVSFCVTDPQRSWVFVPPMESIQTEIQGRFLWLIFMVPKVFFFQSVPAKAARFHLSTIGRVSEIMADAICYCSPYSTSPFFIILHGPKKYPPYSLMEADSFCLPERSVGTSCYM
jgi:hypothetical protein